MVADVDEESNSTTNDRTVIDSECKEVDRRAVVHGARRDVEREASDLLRKEEAEVITKISANETKTVVSTKNESVTNDKKDTGKDVDDQFDGFTLVDRLKHVLDGSETGLSRDHLIVDVITSQTQDEDDDTVDNACSLGVTTENATAQELGLVLSTSNDVPHERIENHMSKNKIHKRVIQIDTLLDLFKVHHFTELTSFHC